MPAVNPQASESAHAFMAGGAKMDVLLCPCCRHGRLHVRAVLAGLGRLPAPANSFVPTCLGASMTVARCNKSAAVCWPLQTRQRRCCVLRHYGLPVLAGAMAGNDQSRVIAQNRHHQTPNSTGDISQAIIYACTRASNLQTPMPPTRAHQGRRFSPTRFICRV